MPGSLRASSDARMCPAALGIRVFFGGRTPDFGTFVPHVFAVLPVADGANQMAGTGCAGNAPSPTPQGQPMGADNHQGNIAVEHGGSGHGGSGGGGGGRRPARRWRRGVLQPPVCCNCGGAAGLEATCGRCAGHVCGHCQVRCLRCAVLLCQGCLASHVCIGVVAGNDGDDQGGGDAGDGGDQGTGWGDRASGHRSRGAGTNGGFRQVVIRGHEAWRLPSTAAPAATLAQACPHGLVKPSGREPFVIVY